MAVRRLYEPLCIAFGTTVSSPTVPTYQLYDLPHKFTPRLYMESEDPNLVLREIGVWAGWEQAGRVEARSFLLDLLKDKDAHDNFLLQQAGPKRFRRVSGIIVLTQKHLRIVQTRGSRLGGPRFQLTYQQACLVHGTKQGARGPRERFVYCHRTLTLEELERYLVPRYYASCLDAIGNNQEANHSPSSSMPSGCSYTAVQFIIKMSEKKISELPPSATTSRWVGVGNIYIFELLSANPECIR